VRTDLVVASVALALSVVAAGIRLKQVMASGKRPPWVIVAICILSLGAGVAVSLGARRYRAAKSARAASAQPSAVPAIPAGPDTADPIAKPR